MTQITADRRGARTEATELTESERHQLLSAAERRIALEVLSERSEPVGLSELAGAVATGVDDSPETVKIGLHHCHLPKLADAGVVRYDASSKHVEATPYLTELLR